MGIEKAKIMRNTFVMALSLVAFTIGSTASTARAASPSDEKIDLHGVVGLDDQGQDLDGSLGFGASAVTDSGDPHMSPHLLPFDTGSGLAPNAVPLPWSGGLGAVGLATLAMRRRRRSRSV